MSVTIHNIEKFVEDIRSGLLSLLFGQEDGVVDTESLTYGYSGVAHAFDRAHTKAIYSNQEAGSPPAESLHGPLQTAQTAQTARTPKGKGSGGPKAGSKAAKERAQKAQETRRRNAAEKAAAGGESINAPAAGTAGMGTAVTRPATGFGGLPQSGPGGV